MESFLADNSRLFEIVIVLAIASITARGEVLFVQFSFTGRIYLSVKSQGFVDKKRGRTLYGRSRAYIRVNGKDYSRHRRGFNVVVINYKSGEDMYFYNYGEYFKFISYYTYINR